MRVTVDRDQCIASGSCVLVCPQVFAQDEEGIAVVRDAQPPENLRDAVELAADNCPSACIVVAD